ncbi:MAG: bifunctional (p)ppGpp synthetase/guanosine-3',5'-bis(diphosphate) 3'-pyrophosphohydrolase [Solirubrobacterales bacterium]|nr:bifunctional (p)ppGpp synthetase/guanosine-3',5'-bis(diphosphate) 3'-pyrophosphohydrolase [Solirubrobacterales bacterium]
MTGGPSVGDLVAHLPRTRAALLYAQRQHAGQRRSDGAPFIAHPLEVARLLHEAGAADQVVAAGLLHDTIEKTSATASELHGRFGPEVTSLVLAVTEDERIAGYRARKAALRAQVSRAGDQALLLFAADKVSKAREFQVGPHPVRRRRLSHYRRCLELLESRLPGTPLIAQLRAELEILAATAGDRPVLAQAT